ncbi:MAG TPA: hypothetical protein VFB51_06150 [Solirubrobacterales bacterium]|nr:hypothetical protein [Solirubrobacterales bacterium]
MNRSIDPSPTAKIVIGSIGLLFGVVRVLTAVVGGLGPGGGAYQAGQVFGVVIVGLVGFFGARYLMRGLEELKASRSGPPAQQSLPITPERVMPLEDVPGSVGPPRRP